MPSKPLRPCSQVGCNELTTKGYCDQHRKVTARNYDSYQRDKKSTSFYNSREWRSVRNQALIRDHNLCQDCLQDKLLTPAEVVDHIKPIKQFWQLRLDLNNLRSLCHSHHNSKTAEDMKRYPSRKK